MSSRKDFLLRGTPSLPSSLAAAFLQKNLLLNTFLEKLLERTPATPLFCDNGSDFIALIMAPEALCRANMVDEEEDVVDRGVNVFLLLRWSWRSFSMKNPTVVQHCWRVSDLKPFDEHELRSSLR